MSELTRGQKAAETRARNKAAAEKAAAEEEALQVNVNIPVPFPLVQQFLASIADIESYVFGDVQDGTAIVTRIDGHDLVAVYDGDNWHLAL